MNEPNVDPDAAELMRRLSNLRAALEDAGMHVCPYDTKPVYCPCAPGKCAARARARGEP